MLEDAYTSELIAHCAIHSAAEALKHHDHAYIEVTAYTEQFDKRFVLACDYLVRDLIVKYNEPVV